MKVINVTLTKLETALQKNVAFRGRSIRFQLTLIILLLMAFSLFLFSFTALYSR
ncbi:hypothetical protein [Flavisolibacter tropicus]|uniref:hypothetical protein n=1 Tax=Flavisolibacter tropicus TaxID=1492898 RepID=UPI001314990E|nr:hypothetical protein [Flavisolibacter tropicus]